VGDGFVVFEHERGLCSLLASTLLGVTSRMMTTVSLPLSAAAETTLSVI